MRKLISILLFVSAFPLLAQTPYLVKDVNPDHSNLPASSSPTSFGSFKNRIYFNATTSAAGTELWSTDGTSGTATMLIDIIPGAGSSGVAALTVLNDVLLFTARDVNHGIELWVTDGTAAGTQVLTDINPGPNSSQPSAMFVYQNKLFFSADDGTHGREPWITDGTAAGTHLLKDLNPGSASSSSGSFVAFANSVYFGAASALWKTDGTEAGTVQVASVPARRFAVAGSQLFFEGFAQASGWEPWVTDGTTAGTRMIIDLFPGSSGSLDSLYDTGLTALGNRIIFPATDGAHGREIWVSDGTETGTHMVRDFVPGPVGMYDTAIPFLTQFAGRAFFQSFDADHGNELWSTDGTDAGTSLFYDANPGPPSSGVSNLTVAGTNLFWSANTTSTLWVTDGTTAGTHALRPSDGLTVFYGAPVQPISGKLYFTGSTALNGNEPWVSDGTDAGTRLLANVAPDTVPSSSPRQLTAAGNQLFFIAQSALSPAAYLNPMLWRSDGTAAGTIPLGPASNGSSVLLAAGSQLLMNGSIADWTQSDGTVSGTKPPTELLSRFGVPGGADVFQFFPFGDRLYVPVHIDADNTILWSTAIQPNSPAVSLGLGNVRSMIDVAGRQYALADAGLSTSDGTAAGTYVVFPTFGNYGSPAAFGQFASAAGTIFLLQYPGGSANAALWKSDGTYDGTSLVKTLLSPYPYTTLTAAGRRVYFVNGTSLWTSDGTADGTVAVTNLNLTPSLSTTYVVYPASGDRVVFLQSDPVAGLQMWGTDGTPAGTNLLMTLGSVSPGPASIDGQVWFTGADAAHGSELWVTDGTPASTRMAADVNPGAGSSNPSSFAKMGNVLYFSAYRDDVGAELWALPLTQTLVNISDTRVAEGDSGTVAAHFNVTLSAAATQTVSVQYATADGTAHSGEDYDAASGTLTFNPGETTKSIDVNVRGDSKIEGNETFFVTLQNPTGGARVVRPAATGIIDDNDQKVDLSLEHVVDLTSNSSVNVKNNGPSGATDVKVLFTSTPMVYQYCPPCSSAIAALASGSSAKVSPYPAGFAQSYASAIASARQPDAQPANNQVSWCGTNGMSMDSAYLTPGVQGTITAGVTFLHVAPAATSSDPSVVTLSTPVLSSDGAKVTVTANALKPGSSTITIGSNQLRVLVSAAGTVPRWPGGVSAHGSAVVGFDQPAQLVIRADGTAPFSGATATGTVTISAPGQQITKALTSQVIYSAYPPSLGGLTYQVDYSGDATFEPQSQRVTVFVDKGQATLTALLEPVAGQPGSFSLKIGAAGSPVTPPSGALSISNGSTEVAKVTLAATSNGNSAAQTILTNLPASPTLTIYYAGDSLYYSTTTNVRSLSLHRRGVRH